MYKYIVDNDLVSKIFEWKGILENALKNQTEEPHEPEENQNAYETRAQPLIDENDIIWFNISFTNIISALFRITEAISYASDLIPKLRDFLTIPNPIIICNIFRAIRYSIKISPAQRDHFYTYNYDRDIIDFIKNPKDFSNFDVDIEAFMALCFLCQNDDAACERYLTVDFFTSLVRLTNNNPRDLDPFLFNLSMLVIENDSVISNFVFSQLFESVCNLFQSEAFVVRIDSLMVLTAILKKSQDFDILNTILHSNILD